MTAYLDDCRRQAQAMHTAGTEHLTIAHYFHVNVRTIQRWIAIDLDPDTGSRRDDIWQDNAACAGHPDPDIFTSEDASQWPQARKICAGCPVQLDCLRFADAHHITDGIWGGLSRRQRTYRKRV